MQVREKLIHLYRSLGVNSSLRSFSNRLQLQKLTYLLEVFGIDLGFKFRWYIHGPYSRVLTKVLYDDDKEESEREVLDHFPQEEQKINALKEFLGRDVTSSHSLELIVSLHYLLALAEKTGESDEEVLRRLQIEKPYFNYNEIKYYYKKLIS